MPNTAIIREYMASLGAKGGAAGEGKAKKRGNSAYYRELARKSAEKRAKGRSQAKGGNSAAPSKD